MKVFAENKDAAMMEILDLTALTEEQTVRLNEIALERMPLYTNMIDSASKAYHENPFWWSTPLSSRNVYISHSFYRICLVLLLMEQIQKNCKEIIVPSEGVKSVLQSYLDKQIYIRVKKSFWSHKARVYDGVMNGRLTSYLSLYRRLCICNTIVKRNRGLFRTDVFSEEDLTLVVCPRIISEFSGGVFVDRYLNGIAALEQRKVVFLDAMVYSNIGEIPVLVKGISREQNHFPIELFVEKRDIKRAMEYQRFCRSIRLERCEINGIDVRAILYEDLKEGIRNDNAVSSYIRAKAINNLIDCFGTNPKCIIEWYEGQPCSNGMWAFLRRWHPEVLSVAYTYGPLGKNEMQVCPSAAQIEYKAVPEIFAVHGTAWEKVINRFTGTVRSTTAPSFRYGEVFDEEYSIGEAERNSILVVLSLYKEESRSMLEGLAAVVERFIVDAHIYIKNHPGNKDNSIADYNVDERRFAKCRVDYVDADIMSAVVGKNYIITTTTTSMLPMILSGAKVIVYNPVGTILNLCVPDEIIEDVNIAYSSRDILNYFEYGLRTVSAERSRRIRDLCYTRADEETTKAFFETIDRISRDRRLSTRRTRRDR